MTSIGAGQLADEITDDTPLTLREACRIYFRDAIKPPTLRAEHRRGMLPIMRIGNKDFVTPAAIKGMMLKKCQERESRHASTSTPSAAHGSSETERELSAQAALKQISKGLKKPSKPTSPASSSQSSASVIPIGSRSSKF